MASDSLQFIIQCSHLLKWVTKIFSLFHHHWPTTTGSVNQKNFAVKRKNLGAVSLSQAAIDEVCILPIRLKIGFSAPKTSMQRGNLKTFVVKRKKTTGVDSGALYNNTFNIKQQTFFVQPKNKTAASIQQHQPQQPSKGSQQPTTTTTT